MKVAIYSGTIPSSVFIENLIEELAKQGITIFLFGKKKSRVEYKSNNIHSFIIPNQRFQKTLFVFFNLMRLIITNPLKFLKLFQYKKQLEINNLRISFNWWCRVLPVLNNLPDIFHLQWAKSLEEWFFLKEVFGVKIVLSLRGTHITCSPIADNSLADQYNLLFPKVDKFHAVSNSLKKIAIKYGAKTKDVDIIYSPINQKNISPFIKKDLGTNDIFKIISIGRFHWIKGYDYALTAIRELLDINILIHYTIITNNTISEEILYQINDLSMSKHITLLNNLGQPDVYKNLSISDCLILPSVEEGIANVLLESMAIGTPVISSDCGGMKEVIDHKKNGFLYENRQIPSLKKQIISLMNMDYLQRKVIIDNAKSHINSFHKISVQGMKMKNLYSSINI